MSGIVKSPMMAVHLTGEKGASLIGVPADGDDGLDVLREEFVEMLGAVGADVALMASGCTYPAGFEPALATVKESLSAARRMPSARWDRQELPVQRMRMVGLFMGAVKWEGEQVFENGDDQAREKQAYLGAL